MWVWGYRLLGSFLFHYPFVIRFNDYTVFFHFASSFVSFRFTDTDVIRYATTTAIMSNSEKLYVITVTHTCHIHIMPSPFCFVVALADNYRSKCASFLYTEFCTYCSLLVHYHARTISHNHHYLRTGKTYNPAHTARRILLCLCFAWLYLKLLQ